MALAEKKKPWVEYNWLSENCGLKVSNICLGTMTFGKASKVGIHYLFCLAFSMTFRRWCSRVQGSNSGATRSVEGLELIIHSFIPAISIAPLQVLYYSEALPTTARILYRSFTSKRTGNCR